MATRDAKSVVKPMCPVPAAMKDLSKVCPMLTRLNEEALASDSVPKSKPYVLETAPERVTNS